MKAHQNNPQQGENQVSDQIKFNIFQSIMDSLFQSFSSSVSVNSFQELSACVFSWIEEHWKPQVSSILYVLWIRQGMKGNVYINITFCPASCGSLLDTEGVCCWCPAAAQWSALLMEWTPGLASPNLILGLLWPLHVNLRPHSGARTDLVSSLACWVEKNPLHTGLKCKMITSSFCIF